MTTSPATSHVTGSPAASLPPATRPRRSACRGGRPPLSQEHARPRAQARPRRRVASTRATRRCAGRPCDARAPEEASPDGARGVAAGPGPAPRGAVRRQCGGLPLGLLASLDPAKDVPLRSAATFLLIENDYLAGNLADAARGYTSFIETFPDAPERPQAELRLGLALVELGEADAARPWLIRNAQRPEGSAADCAARPRRPGLRRGPLGRRTAGLRRVPRTFGRRG